MTDRQEYMREYSKKYYQEHREQYREYWRKWHQEHREQKREYDKKYYQEHREQKREYYKKYHQEHREQEREYRKKCYYKTAKGHIKNRISSWKRYGIKICNWQEYQALFLKAGGKCEICKKPLRMTPIEKRNIPVAHLDHDYVTGLPRGILCRQCNARVGFFEDRANKYRSYLEQKQKGEDLWCRLGVLVADIEA